MKLQKGYSVVELMMVMVVLGIVFAIAVPSLISANRNKRLMESGREIVQVMHEARFKAIAENSSKKIQINTSNNTIQTSKGEVIALPKGIRFKALDHGIEPPAQIKDAVSKCGSLKTQEDDPETITSFEKSSGNGIYKAEFDAKGLPKVEPGVVNWVYLVNDEAQPIAVLMTSAGACEVMQYNSKTKTWK